MFPGTRFGNTTSFYIAFTEITREKRVSQGGGSGDVFCTKIFNSGFRNAKILKSAKILNSGLWQAKNLKSAKILKFGLWKAKILRSAKILNSGFWKAKIRKSAKDQDPRS